MKSRAIKLLPILVVALVSAFDYAGAFGYRGDDWANFDRKSVRASNIISGDKFVLNDGTTVQLLGVAAPEEPMHFSREAMQYLTARLKDRSVILQLDGTQTRDDAGNLLAYVFVTVGDCLNVDMVRDGQAFADRRIKSSQRPAIEAVETEARKKHRGLWNGLNDEQMPAWRRAWLDELRKRRAGN